MQEVRLLILDSHEIRELIAEKYGVFTEFVDLKIERDMYGESIICNVILDK